MNNESDDALWQEFTKDIKPLEKEKGEQAVVKTPKVEKKGAGKKTNTAATPTTGRYI